MTLRPAAAPLSLPAAAQAPSTSNEHSSEAMSDAPTLDALPAECQHSIFGYLETPSLASLAITNRALRPVAQSLLGELTINFGHPVFASEQFLQNPETVLGRYTGVKRLTLKGMAAPEQIDALGNAVETGACRGARSIDASDLWLGARGDHLGALLSQFPRLRAVNMPRQGIGEADFNRILTFTQLESLDLAGVCARLMNHETIERLGAMRELRSLRLPWSEAFDDQAMQILSRFEKLEQLDLPGASQVSPAGFGVLGDLTSLRRLNLFACGLNDHALGFLANLRHLEHLDLGRNPGLRGASLEAAEGLQSLQSLDLTGCGALQSQALSLVERNKGLRELKLEGCRHLTDQDIARLSGLNQLEALNLSHVGQITADGLRHLSALPELRRLALKACQQIDDQGLAHLEPLKQLQKLWLTGCGTITDRGLESLGRLLGIEELMLNVRDPSQVSPKGLENLLKLPRLKLLELPMRLHPMNSPQFVPTLDELRQQGCEWQF